MLLDDVKKGVNDPVDQPPRVVLFVVRFYGFDGGVDGVKEPDQITEEAWSKHKVSEEDYEGGGPPGEVGHLDAGLGLKVFQQLDLFQVLNGFVKSHAEGGNGKK